MPLIAHALGLTAWIAAPAPLFQDTTRISVDSFGGEVTLDCIAIRGSAAIENGEGLVVFHSTAGKLVAKDTNGFSDIFLRNLAQGTTTRIVFDLNGGETDNHSSVPRITPDGRFVLFTSNASDLVKGDGNVVSDAFVLDRANGAMERVSVNDGGGELDRFSNAIAISPDGNFVLFSTQSTNADPNDGNGLTDLFLRDRAQDDTILVSVTPAGVSANDSTLAGSIAADGRHVAFESRATDLVPNDTNARSDIFVRDLASGTTTRIVNDGGFELDRDSFQAQLSDDGKLLAFVTAASNLHRDSTDSIQQVYVRDLTTGELWLASRGVDGFRADNSCSQPTLFTRSSAAGPRDVVAFQSSATNLFDDGLADRDAFAVDFRAGFGQCATVDSAGVDAADPHSVFTLAAAPGGEFLALTTDQDGLAPGDTDTDDDVYVRGLQWTTPTEFGVGLGGSGGFVPHLTGHGGSCESGRWSIELTDGLGGAAGHLWVGLGRTNGLRLFGGTFYLDFTQPLFPIAIALGGTRGVAGAGGFLIPGSNVEDVGQFSIFLQGTLLDANAPRGVSLSNALQIELDA